MRILSIAGAALLIAGAANAQADRPAATKAYVDACVEQLDHALENPEPVCACEAGFFSASMTESQYRIVGRLSPYWLDLFAMNSEINKMTANEGYTADQIFAAVKLFDSLDEDITLTCEILQR